MSSLVQTLVKKQTPKLSPPKWLPENIHYETMMGSVAYGVAGESSDWDVYGFCIPPKDVVFPHTAGYIPGFGIKDKPQEFNQYQQHHINDPDGKHVVYDISIYNIVKYFQLCMENNPNMIDSLYTPTMCVLHITEVGNMGKG